MKQPRIWYAIADGGRARILEKHKTTEAFTLLREFISPVLHRHTRELGVARPGRSHESAASARHAMAPRCDLHRESKDLFLKNLADELNHANRRGEFDILVLAAPGRALNTLTHTLNTDTKQRIAAQLQKDLTKTPSDALEEHFKSLALQIAARWRRLPH